MIMETKNQELSESDLKKIKLAAFIAFLTLFVVMMAL